MPVGAARPCFALTSFLACVVAVGMWWSPLVVVQVLKRGDTKKFFAKALCIGDECDLALMVRGGHMGAG